MTAPTLEDIRRRLQGDELPMSEDQVWYYAHSKGPKPDDLLVRIDTPYQDFNDNPFDDGCNVGMYGAWDWPEGVGQPNYAAVLGWIMANHDTEEANFWLHEDHARQFLPDGTRCRGSDNDGFISFWFRNETMAGKFLDRWSGRMINSRGGTM